MRSWQFCLFWSARASGEAARGMVRGERGKNPLLAPFSARLRPLFTRLGMQHNLFLDLRRPSIGEVQTWRVLTAFH